MRDSEQARAVHPLLGAFPLAVMTLAILAVLFALTMAKLNASTDPDLGASPGIRLVARDPGGDGVKTRPDGARGSNAAAKPVVAPAPSGTTAEVVTRADHAPGTTKASDE